MKKSISFILAVIITMTFASCNSTNKKKNTQVVSISIGDTIETDSYKFILRDVEFSYDVKPDNEEAFYSHYPADEGYVYIHVDADIKNLSDNEIPCDNVYTVVADYNGSLYQGYPVAETTDGDFTDADSAKISAQKNLGIHNLVNCPEETDLSDLPLKIIITLSNNSKYEYIIR